MTEEETHPTDLKFVGPATAEVLAGAGFDADGIREKTVSFRMLVDAGVNPGVAAKIRRYHSLSWSFESEDGSDLERRSSQIRGLGDAERAWVAASSGDWEDRDPVPDDQAGEAAWVDAETRPDVAPEADGSGDPVAAETAWRDRSAPTPVTSISGIGEKRAADLAEAGINSVRALSAADPEEVAEAIGWSTGRARKFRDAAEEYVG